MALSFSHSHSLEMILNKNAFVVDNIAETLEIIDALINNLIFSLNKGNWIFSEERTQQEIGNTFFKYWTPSNFQFECQKSPCVHCGGCWPKRIHLKSLALLILIVFTWCFFYCSMFIPLKNQMKCSSLWNQFRTKEKFIKVAHCWRQWHFWRLKSTWSRCHWQIPRQQPKSFDLLS